MPPRPRPQNGNSSRNSLRARLSFQKHNLLEGSPQLDDEMSSRLQVQSLGEPYDPYYNNRGDRGQGQMLQLNGYKTSDQQDRKESQRLHINPHTADTSDQLTQYQRAINNQAS